MRRGGGGVLLTVNRIIRRLQKPWNKIRGFFILIICNKGCFFLKDPGDKYFEWRDQTWLEKQLKEM
jgi:hypothetical protein